MTSDTLAAVLWDMDGTLIDSEPLWIKVELEMLERYGLAMSEDTHQRMIGSGLWEAAEHFRELGVPLSADEIVAEWVAGVSQGIATTDPHWRPGARELLSSLQEAGIPCALVTMSVRSLAESVVAMLPEGTFRAIIAGDEVEFEKPHPDPYLRGAAALGVPIAACVAFEDSPTGLRSAYASGAVAIGVPNMVPLEGSPSHALEPTLEGLSAHAVEQRYLALRSTHSSSAPQPAAEEASL